MADSRVALVTGGAQGMGRAMAEVLAEAGHRVVGLDRLDQERGPLERVVAADLLDPETPRRVVDDIVATEGRLDILVNNAAIFVPDHPLAEVTMDDYERQTVDEIVQRGEVKNLAVFMRRGRSGRSAHRRSCSPTRRRPSCASSCAPTSNSPGRPLL